MQEYKNLVIIGTSHISVQSIREVSNFIEKNKPEIIALELDKKRFFALTQERKNDFRDVLIGSYIEKKLGRLVGVKPGSEMIKAIELAKKHNLAIALIDQDIQITLKKLTKISFKEKFKIFKDIIKGMLFKKEIVKFDLTKVPDEKLIDVLIGKVKKDYPEIYSILIKERNELMAKALNKIITLNKDKKILAIIGAGHEKEVVRIIRTLDSN